MSTLSLAGTPVSYLNQAFLNIVNPHRQFTIIMNTLRWNQQLFYTFPGRILANLASNIHEICIFSSALNEAILCNSRYIPILVVVV